MVTLDGTAGIYDDLTVYNRHGEDIQRSWRRTSNNLPLGIEERAVARAVKLMLVFSPGNGTTQMGAAMPQGQHTAIFEAGDEEAAF